MKDLAEVLHEVGPILMGVAAIIVALQPRKAQKPRKKKKKGKK